MPTDIPFATPRAIQDVPPRDLTHWARLLDEDPDTIRRAIAETGPELSALRSFLFGRQLGLDFDSSPADAGASHAHMSRR
jgi:hypothetical protein